MDVISIDLEVWETAMDLGDSYFDLPFFARNWEILHNGYALVPDMAEFYQSTLQATFGSAKQPMNFPTESYDELNANVYSTFPGKRCFG